WERGSDYEAEVIANAPVAMLDLSGYGPEEKARLTREAMAQGEPWIYSGRIGADDLLGEPDLMRLEDGGYVAGDIKSGSGEEGEEGSGKLKRHYAVQLALYTDILERLGLSAGRYGFIWDIRAEEVAYDFDRPLGVRNTQTYWDLYQESLEQARAILGRSEQTRAAYAATCKLCHWYSNCLGQLKAADDLSLIPELGRAKRDALVKKIPTIHEFAACDIAPFIRGGRTDFPGIGPATLKTLQTRAQLIADPKGKPYLKEPVQFPNDNLELFFDIEVDPMRDVCYLHGFIERRGRDPDTERYVPFFADAPNAPAEEKAFADAWRYVQDNQPCAIYYYSKYERTIWRKLRERFPHVCSEDDIEAMFDPERAIDLYTDVVRKHTEWPTRDHSIKTLARYLGFNWRDTDPSGAASIEWYHRYIEQGDASLRQRILDYNEDDCRATRVLLDGIRTLPVMS
ncbi:MAG: TM0106 family RecB-like putative nuclease, partial [Gammaproteobacteria bacterium]